MEHVRQCTIICLKANTTIISQNDLVPDSGDSFQLLRTARAFKTPGARAMPFQGSATQCLFFEPSTASPPCFRFHQVISHLNKTKKTKPRLRSDNIVGALACQEYTNTHSSNRALHTNPKRGARGEHRVMLLRGEKSNHPS